MNHTQTEQTVNLIQYYHTLTRHKWVIIASVVIGVSLALWYNSKLIPIYRATATLIIDRESAYSPLTGQRTDYETYLSESMTFNTHFELITSRPVLEKVVKDLKLDRIDKNREKNKLAKINPLRELVSRLKENTLLLLGRERKPKVTKKLPDPEERLSGLVQMVRGMVSIEPVEDTRLLNINIVSPSPVKARDIANGVAQAYIDFNLNNRMKSSQNTLKWLTDHLYEMKKKLEDAEEEFLAYKQSTNLISLEESQKIIAQKMTDFNDAYIQARNRRLELGAKLEEISRILKSSKDIRHLRSLISNELINNLYGQLINAEGELARLRKVYKFKHHKIIETNTLIADTRKKLNQEMGKELDNLKAERTLLLNKEKVIQKTISDFKKEAMEINTKELKYTILKRNVEMNQRLYDTIMSRLKEADITANIDVSNIRIMERALLPGFPIGPNKKRNVLLGIVMGLIIGIGLSFLWENLDRTLHTEEDIQKYLDLPVLSVIPVAQKAKKLSYGAKGEG